MQFTIEVEDFYLDEDKELEPALKSYIINAVKNDIYAGIKAKIEDHVTKEVKAQVEQSLYRKISTLVGEIIATDTIKGKYSNDPDTTLQEYVKSQFKDKARDASPVDDNIKKLAKACGDEIKSRYDLLFASQLVAKLHESGLLKEDVAKLLLPQS